MIRVLLADDSRAFRAVLRAILARAPQLEVVGEAADGAEAVALTALHRPDVVTMDVRMPGLDGLAAIEAIMARCPTPVVVVSGEVGPAHQENAFRALQLGAVEVLRKPSATEAGRFERDADAIRMAVRTVAGLKVVPRHPRRPRPAPGARPTGERLLTPSPPGERGRGEGPRAARAIGVAASTGGPPALARLLAALPASLPAAVLVVQHIAAGFERGLVHWLARESALPVKVAEHGEPLRAGTVYFAPPDRHLTALVGTVFLDGGPAIQGFRPSGTALFRSLAREFGPAATGLILTGMGEDGVEGLRAVREAGGATVAQGPASSVVYGMPRAALERGAAEVALELDELPAALAGLARGVRPAS